MRLTTLRAAWAWQSRAVLGRHLRVHLRKWHTAALPPICEPVILLLAFGLGLGQHVTELPWRGQTLDYLTFLAPGILAYTAFMAAFFQALFAAFIRMHFQRSWEGQLTTQVRIEHVVWGEALWAATLGTVYAIFVALVLGVFGLAGWITLQWHWVPLVIPILFVAALAFSAMGLWFTAKVPTIDHMSIPFFLVIMPLGFTSSTYFPLDASHPVWAVWLGLNPLHHLSEGVRLLLVRGAFSHHLISAVGLCLVLIIVLLPWDLRLLRRRVLGENT